jgi:hypothetical protein
MLQMRKPPLRSRQPLHCGQVERVSVSLTKEDKDAVEKIARERRVSIAWVVREAVIEFLSKSKGK